LLGRSEDEEIFSLASQKVDSCWWKSCLSYWRGFL
jgi:hypothetical protein